MNIKLVVIGKTDHDYFKKGIEEYSGRLKHYIKFELEVIPDVKNVKNLSEEQQKEQEGKKILEKLTAGCELILFDEEGKSYSSVSFSEFLQKKMNAGLKELIFVVGGPYGFSKEVYQRASGKISLSAMTFSHQMVRLFIVEQLYRAFTIIKGEPYHHR